MRRNGNEGNIMTNYDYAYFEGEDLKQYSKPVKPTLDRNPTSEDARTFADALDDYERQFDSYKESCAYNEAQKTLRMKELQETMQADYDINEKQFALLWTTAYEDGHSEGLHQVVNRFDEYYDMASAFAALEG